MSIIEVQAVGQESLDRAQKLLAGIPGGMDKAVKSAMQRTVSHLRTNSANAIRERYDISAANIRAEENVSIRYSYRDGIQAFVRFAGGKIPLFRYGGASPSAPTFDQNRLVPAMIHGKWRMVHPGVPARGHQLKESTSTLFEYAFIAQMKSGHVGIFERNGSKSISSGDAISEVMGSSVPQMLGSEEVSEKLGQEAMEKFDERLEHEVLARLNGWV